MGHLDELDEKMKDKGLTVLAVTRQDRSAVDKFVEETGAKHPIVMESTDSMRSYGCTGFPSSFLIDPGGRILWSGHPGNLKDSQIEEALGQARILPDFPAALKSARKSFEKEKLSDAQKAVRKVLDGGKLEGEDQAAAEQIAAWFDWYADATLEGAGKDVEAGNYYEAWVAYNNVSRWYKGTDVSKRSAELAKQLLADGDQKAEIKAGDKLAKIQVVIRGVSPKKALKALAPMTGKKYRDTKAGKKAAELIKQYEAAKR